MKAGWEVKALGEVCSFLNRGISPKYTEEGGVCVLNQKCIRNHRINYEQSRRHNIEIKSVNAERFIQVGDVLVNSTGTGTLGRVAQVRDIPSEQTAVDSHVTIVRPKQGKFFPDFFGYMLIVIEEEIKKAGEGCGGQTELARSVLAEKFHVSFPVSLPEQQRIVAILDKAFASIATAKANTEQNLKNARALFDSYLHEVFSQRGEGWEEKTLNEVCTIEKSQGNYKNLPYVGLEHIESNTGRFIGSVQPMTVKSSTFKFSNEHILYGRLRPYLNKVIIPDFIGHCSTEIFPIKPCLKLSKEFLFYWFISNETVNKINATCTGARMPRANMNDVLNFEFPLAPIHEQEIIVSNLDALKKETQRLETLYQRKLTALDELKKSLLHKAFNGDI